MAESYSAPPAPIMHWKATASNKAPEALSAEEMSAITRFACCAASLSTRRHGGINSIPEEQEVLELMRQG